MKDKENTPVDKSFDNQNENIQDAREQLNVAEPLASASDGSIDTVLDSPVSRNATISGRKYAVGSIAIISFLGSITLNIAYFISQQESMQPSNSLLFWLLAIGLVTITIISLTFTFGLQYLRAVYLKEGPALVPEKWGLLVDQLTIANNKLASINQISLKEYSKSAQENSTKSSDLLESFLTLQQALSNRDEEINRLKKGHDSKVFKKFLGRFIRLDRSMRLIESETNNAVELKNYKYLIHLLKDALEECGVEVFIPEIGSDYRNVGVEVADGPEEVITQDINQDFTISECVEEGYMLLGLTENEVVKPAKVKIYRYETIK